MTHPHIAENHPEDPVTDSIRIRRAGSQPAVAEALADVLIVLDTVTGGDGERLYARLGWQRCGVIPNYALWPQGGGLCSTTVFYRVL